MTMHLISATMFVCLLAMSRAAVLVNPYPTHNIGSKVKYLEAGERINYEPTRTHRGIFEKDLRTYCYRGEVKTLARLFESVELILEIEGDDYTQYDGATPDEVQAHYDEHRSLFSFNLFSQKRTRLQLSPFTSSCLGIETIEPYHIRLHKLRVDFWRVIQLVVGCLVFQYAGKLSHNALFYYITGVSLGVCSSFMLIIWLSSKLVPRRTVTYGILIGGWTIGLYVIQMLWENLQLIVLTYRSYVFWYISITGIVSFFFCYRWGPPTNKRSKNIIKWLLQLMSLIMIYLSSHYEEATAAIIIITIVLHYFPRSLWYKGRALWLRKFPPKRRFLTNEEYYEQGVRETTKALTDLRQFANSPDCNQWRTMSKLRDPLRFAAFVEGASHLRDEEILRFESSKCDDDDDSNDSDLVDLSDSEVEEAELPQYSKSYSGAHRPRSRRDRRRLTDDEISEDEDFNNGYANGDDYRYGDGTPLNTSHTRSIHTTTSSSAIKQRYSYVTPTVRLSSRQSSRQSSVTGSANRLSRREEREFNDEG